MSSKGQEERTSFYDVSGEGWRLSRVMRLQGNQALWKGIFEYLGTGLAGHETRPERKGEGTLTIFSQRSREINDA